MQLCIVGMCRDMKPTCKKCLQLAMKVVWFLQILHRDYQKTTLTSGHRDPVVSSWPTSARGFVLCWFFLSRQRGWGCAQRAEVSCQRAGCMRMSNVDHVELFFKDYSPNPTEHEHVQAEKKMSETHRLWWSSSCIFHFATAVMAVRVLLKFLYIKARKKKKSR